MQLSLKVIIPIKCFETIEVEDNGKHHIFPGDNDEFLIRSISHMLLQKFESKGYS